MQPLLTISSDIGVSEDIVIVVGYYIGTQNKQPLKHWYFYTLTDNVEVTYSGHCIQLKQYTTILISVLKLSKRLLYKDKEDSYINS